MPRRLPVSTVARRSSGSGGRQTMAGPCATSVSGAWTFSGGPTSRVPPSSPSSRGRRTTTS
eukprot:8304053-Alexandrium_andersonii.AAC.1